MIRNIRLLGIALGGLVGIGLAQPAGLLVITSTGGVDVSPSGGVFLIAWIAAWLVVGFAILPYLTVVPASWLFKAVQELSTAEFVTAVAGLLLGLLILAVGIRFAIELVIRPDDLFTIRETGGTG